MNKAPAFQFYADAWLSSPKIMLMTPAQEGAYIRLLAIAWNDPDCSIPDDDNHLAVLSRMGEGWLKGGSTLVRECFEPHPNKTGRLVNLRLLEERQKQQLWREKSQAGGIRSAQVRQEKALTGRVKKAKGGSRVVEPKGNSLSLSLSLKEDMSSEVFNHWKTVLNHPRAILDAKRRRLISSRLDEGFLAEDLKVAIDGCKASPWHMGKVPENSTVYDGLDLILRDAEHIDQFIAKARNGNGNGHTGGPKREYCGNCQGGWLRPDMAKGETRARQCGCVTEAQ